jgi:hypothetical protein
VHRLGYSTVSHADRLNNKLGRGAPTGYEPLSNHQGTRRQNVRRTYGLIQNSKGLWLRRSIYQNRDRLSTHRLQHRSIDCIPPP